MFKGSKSNKPTKRSRGEGGTALMQQMGFQIPNFDDPDIGAEDDDDDDDDLQAELALMEQNTGGQTSKRPKANQKKAGGAASDLQSFHSDVNKLLNDIDRPINDDELSDGDDEDLLAELHEMTGEIEEERQDEHVETKQVQSTSNGNCQIRQNESNGNIVSVLETRLGMYKKAVDTAKTSGDAAKARRYDRQFKLIQELLQSARTGAPINEAEIPPAIGVSATSASQPTIVSQQVPVRAPSPPPPPSQPSTASLQMHEKPVASEPPVSVPVPTSNNSDEAIARLKSLALQAKADGDMVKAKEYIIQMKTLQSGATPNSAPPPPPASAQTEMHDTMPEDENSAAASMPLKAPEPRTVMEALQQRHEELVKRHQEAISKGDSSKARRMDRLTKQYQEAIEVTRKGRPYDYSELPDLPGFAPIPVQQPKPQPPPSTAAVPVKTSQSTTQVKPTQPPQQRSMPPTGSIPQPAAKASTNIRQDQQVQSLRLKQEQFQKLAAQAKRNGDNELAKKYLIESKKLEQTTASAASSISTDMNRASESPSQDYDMVRDDELTEEISQASRETIYHRLQEDLLRQVQLCARNQQMYAQMEGLNNIKQANEFKLLEQRSAHDLERVRQSFQQGLKAPVFHYEKRQMNIIQVNNDLTDNDFEVTVLRGINLQVPSGYSATALETYVIIEFPYPPETPQTARTRQATGSTNAEYSGALHKFQIKRTDTKFKRVVNRKELKLSIFYKAGFLRSDRQLGTAAIKLIALEQTSTIHESVDVYENDHKKKPEGKLEVKIRIKEAIGQIKSAELLSQRWLVIDRFEEISANSKPSTTKSPTTAPVITALSRLIPTGETLGLLAINLPGYSNSEKIIDSSRSNAAQSNNDKRRDSQSATGPQSIQVLKYEADLLQEQIEQLEDHLTPDQIDLLRVKHKALQEQNDGIVDNLRHGGKQAAEEHVRGLEQLLERYTREEDEYRQRNDKKKADIFLNKKNLVVKEIETFTDQPSSIESTPF